MRVTAVAALLTMSVSGVSTAREVLWHIKAVHPEGRLFNVKAMDKRGKIYDGKAIEQHGNRHLMDVKGARRTGKIIHSKAIGPGGQSYGVKEISPGGPLHDVKGVKMFEDGVEATINGLPVAAHIKALPQVLNPEG